MDKTKILSAIEHRAYNDVTRTIERDGIHLTWDEVDALGEMACDWLRQRLNLMAMPDGDGMSFRPRPRCSQCRGYGTVWDGNAGGCVYCPKCGGKGTVDVVSK